MANLPEPFDMSIFYLYSSGGGRSSGVRRALKSKITIDKWISIGRMCSSSSCIIPTTKGGENMDKDQIKSLVAGLGIAGLVAGVSIAAPSHAAQSG